MQLRILRNFVAGFGDDALAAHGNAPDCLASLATLKTLLKQNEWAGATLKSLGASSQTHRAPFTANPSVREPLALGRALGWPPDSIRRHEERELQDRPAWAPASNPIRFRARSGTWRQPLKRCRFPRECVLRLFERHVKPCKACRGRRPALEARVDPATRGIIARILIFSRSFWKELRLGNVRISVAYGVRHPAQTSRDDCGRCVTAKDPPPPGLACRGSRSSVQAPPGKLELCWYRACCTRESEKSRAQPRLRPQPEKSTSWR